MCRRISTYDIVSVTVFVPSDALQHTCMYRFQLHFVSKHLNFCDSIMFSSILVPPVYILFVSQFSQILLMLVLID